MPSKKINEVFFERPSAEAAYILGYVYADGSLSDRGRKNSWMLDITSKDCSHLERIAEILSAKYKIGTKRKSKNGKQYINFRIQIANCKICNGLRKLGFDAGDKVALPPNISEKFYSDFIRGFFDGDGSVYVYKVNGTTQLKGNFSSKDKKLLMWLNDFLSKKLEFPRKTIYRDKRTDVWLLCFYQRDCEKLYRFMYHKKGLQFVERQGGVGAVAEKLTNFKVALNAI